MTYRQATLVLGMMVALASAAPIGCCCVIPIPAAFDGAGPSRAHADAPAKIGVERKR